MHMYAEILTCPIQMQNDCEMDLSWLSGDYLELFNYKMLRNLAVNTSQSLSQM